MTAGQATAGGRAGHGCLHRWFEQQAGRTPGAVAVAGERVLTYRELDERSNRLSQHLRRLGVRAGDLVAVCLERSTDIPVATLAVLKAGAAYVPLDPAYPQERLTFMLTDCGARVVVGRDGTLAWTGTVGAVRTVSLERDAAAIEACTSATPGAGVSGRDLAYVIYTSGSTGTPKGVMVEHRNVVRLLTATEPWFGFGPGDVWTLFHSYAFDFSVWEMWGALLHGGRLVIVPHLVARSPQDFTALLEEQRVTVLNQTPSAFRQLLDTPSFLRSNRLALRLVVFGGEALHPVTLAPWFERHGDGGPRLVNMYGITETTVHVTYHPVTPASVGDARSIVGVPIPDLDVHVLDERRRPVPPGEPGELYVSGAGVARGYLNRPALTAERFLDRLPGVAARAYRTGDRGRWLPEGVLEYLGRVDDQIKLRGYRIEPGEVEEALRRHGDVADAVVVARPDHNGHERLVAYVTSASGRRPPTGRSLRTYLVERLPGHMVPAVYVPLGALPTTPSGKVDRNALPDPAGAGTQPPPELPRTEAERALARIWDRVLGEGASGRHDTFLGAGGDSLQSVRVLRAAREELGWNVDPRLLLSPATLAEIAATAPGPRAEAGGGVDGSAPARRAGARRYPLSFSQQMVWFLHHYDPLSVAYNAQALVRFSGPLDGVLLERSLQALVDRHETFRTRVRDRDGEGEQEVLDRLQAGLARHDLSAACGDAGERCLDLLQRYAAVPFDPARAPLFRWVLVTLGQGEHALLHVEHHLIRDGWSSKLFVGELADTYRALSEGRPPAPQPERLQAGDFAAWQRGWVASATARRQLGYWTRQLDGLKADIDLPRDRPPPQTQAFAGATRRAAVEAALQAAVSRFARHEGVSTFSALLAAFYALLHQHSGETDLAVGSGFANRRAAGTETIMGMLINTVVLRVDAGGDPTFAALSRRAGEAVAGAFANQELPFEQLVKHLGLPRDPGRNALFQVGFNYHEVVVPAPLPGGVTVDVVDGIGNGSAKFDLNLTVVVKRERGAAAARETVLVWEYGTAVFDHDTAGMLLDDYRRLLAAAVADPGRRLSGLTAGAPAGAGRPPPPGRPAGAWARPAVTAAGAGGGARDLDVLLGIWREVLGAADASPDDNFFALGGDSMTAVQVVARARQAGFDVSVAGLFAHPTVRQLGEAAAAPAPPDAAAGPLLSPDDRHRLGLGGR